MRLLLSSWAWPSHYMLLVPLGQAARAAGHEVVVASQPALQPTVVGSGLPFAAVGHDVDYEAAMRGPTIGLPPPQADRAWWAGLLAAATPARAMHTFRALADAMVDDLVGFARWWRPDVVVHDTTTFAAAIAAAVLGVPSVRHTYGPDLMATFPGQADGLSGLLDRYGLGPAALDAATTVDPCPRSMQVASGLHRTWVRHVPYNGPAVLPGWLLTRPDRPRIAVTCGTTSTKLDGARRSLTDEVVDAVDGLDVEVVLTLAAHDLARVGTLPPRVRAVEFLPLHLLLPTCDLLVHRGGGSTIMTGLNSGLPQLLLPRIPDQAFNAHLLGRTGAGRLLFGETPDAGALRAAITGLLGDPAYATAARALRAELEQQATPAEVVAALAALERSPA